MNVTGQLLSRSPRERQLALLDCRECRTSLDIHQPNPAQPDQFLGTCQDCGARGIRIDGSSEATGRGLVDPAPRRPGRFNLPDPDRDRDGLTETAGLNGLASAPLFGRLLRRLGSGRRPGRWAAGGRSAGSGDAGISRRRLARVGRRRGRRGSGRVLSDRGRPGPRSPRPGRPAGSGSRPVGRSGCGSRVPGSNNRPLRAVMWTSPSAGNSISRQKKPKSSTATMTAWNFSPMCPAR